MPQDFPAAHSMDSTWFAVDLDGQVALFDTGEGGAVPMEGFPLGREAGGADPFDAAVVLEALLRRKRSELPELAELLPDDASIRQLLDALDWDDEASLAVMLGLWVYGNEDGWAVPYHRSGFPAEPVTLEALGDDLKARLKGAVLAIRFAEAPLVQPGEHAPVAAWGSVWGGVDGSVHPTADGKPRLDELEEASELLGEWRESVDPAEVEDHEAPDLHLVDFVRSALQGAPPPPPPPDVPESWMARLQRKLFGG
ncbi:MAG: hypothetical protein H6736_08700 [Alphaproteobacteria bacterium]|nr:hypothetical protein [Alphaproteobacteria bacterium]MCB9691880.1 hypothetical protein [Alphaproteobacteria bacterium]